MSKTENLYRVIRVLRFFCPEHLLEEIEGDLFQKFDKDVDKFGINKAKRKLLWNALRYLRPGIVMRNRILLKPQQC